MRMFKKSSVEKTTYTWDPEQEIDNFIGFVRSGDEHFWIYVKSFV